MKKIPLFVLAGYDLFDHFGQKKLLTFKIGQNLVLEHLLYQAKKSGCFSEIYCLAPKKLKEKLEKKCIFIKSKKSLERNLKLIYNTAIKNYGQEAQIAIISSDLLPKSNEFQKLMSTLEPFLEKDLILICIETEKLRIKKNSFMLKKDNFSPPINYSGGGDFFIVKVGHLREKLIYFLVKILRPLRRITKKTGLKGLKLLKILMILIKLLIRFPQLRKELILGFKTFKKYQKESLTFEEVEKVYSKIFIKKEFQKINQPSCHLQIIDLPSFVEDIDSFQDFEILKKHIENT